MGDLVAHGIGAIAITLLFGPIINAAFWLAREAFQRWQKEQHWTYMFTSLHVIREWSVPTVIGVVIYFFGVPWEGIVLNWLWS